MTALVMACEPTSTHRRDHPDDAFETLAAGAFLPREVWLDLRDLHAAESRHAPRPAWRVPPPSRLVVESGWGGAEAWGMWGLGEGTRLTFHLAAPANLELHLVGRAARHADGRRQRVTARVNGRELGGWEVGTSWSSERLEVPVAALVAGANRLELSYGYHLEGSAEDDRPRALAIERLGFLPPGSETPRGPSSRLYHAQRLLVLSTPGSWIVPLELDRATRGLAVDVEGSRGFRVGGEVRVQARLLDLEGTEVLRQTWVDGEARLPLDGVRARRALLVVEVDVPAGGSVTLGRPRWLRDDPGDPAGDPAPAAPPASAADASRAPNIVLVVLDAARADHFGVYGYQRATTPYIDRLARESLVYTQAVAECSYTVCSMPGLLAGLSFVEHGLIGRNLALRGQVETLAEMLQARGYRTVGFTGNPNNSRLTGTDQGFDAFIEAWATHPEAITRGALEEIATADPARPLFLMLHYVPPHEPYTPDPEHDLFGDPAYAGPVVGERRFTQQVFDGKLVLDPADLAELEALYDGNLRMADAAVGRVVKALRAAELFDDTLIVVTADHGEAFMEHDRVGHNSTVYSEMLRVPLILKPPRGWAAAGVDTGRFVTLADVVATLHRRLDLGGEEPAWGYDLLAPTPGAAERLLFLRSGHADDPILGVRTSRFKALTQAGRLPELYDLKSDPGERRNLAAERPLLHAGLLLFLARAIDATAGLRADPRLEAISRQDREQLEALGYL